jgi:predicted GNAT superfamily acetyltransferase
MATLRDLTTLEDCRAVVALEKEVWGYTDAEDVVPAPVLIVTIKRGGVLIGAFEGERMVGFVYSLPGIKAGKVMQWSHMLGVTSDRRNSGLGRTLKLAQREKTLSLGLDLVEWTFDPMQALNAHLNFARLGVLSDEYEVNIYGESSSALHRGAPTDRLVAQWRLRSPIVEQCVLEGRRPIRTPAEAAALPAANRLDRRSGPPASSDERLDLDVAEAAIAIPTDFTELLATAPDAALAWRLATRRLFTAYFDRRYAATEFVLDRANRRGYYILTRNGAQGF